MSVIGLAASAGGVRTWQVQPPEPVLTPAGPHDAYSAGVDPALVARIESGGVEDARIGQRLGVDVRAGGVGGFDQPGRVSQCFLDLAGPLLHLRVELLIRRLLHGGRTIMICFSAPASTPTRRANRS